jgi:asparagine synthase (glutamine-hydrolysing)
MIMACLDTQANNFPCYTFGSMYRETFDVQVGREVARACGQPHHVLLLGEEFLSYFPKYLEQAVYISDGYLGMSGAAELYMNDMARKLAPVRLTGNYGGELLRGHRAFKCEIPRGRFFNQEFKPFLLEAQKTFRYLENTDAVTFALFHQAPTQGYGRLTIEKSMIIPRTPFMDNDLVKLVYRAPLHLLQGETVSVSVIARYRPNLLRITTDRGLLGDSGSLRGVIRQIHRKGLIKAEYLSSHGMPNWLAAITGHHLDPFLQKSFFGRDKFQHFRYWTQKKFGNFIKEAVYQGAKDFKEIFNLYQIEKMVTEHLAGKQNYLDEIDKLLTLSLSKRCLMESYSVKDGHLQP